MNFEKRIEKFNELIKNAKKIVFFGGAGVSTESGIPDFRSKDGLYNTMGVKFEKYSPEYLLSRDCLRKEPEVFFEFYRQKMNCEGIEPNIAHKVLAKMEAAGKLTSVITQNIDGLHQKAGSKAVYELHGSVYRNTCMRCKKHYMLHELPQTAVPYCTECGGLIKPDVVLYEEPLEDKVWNNAIRAIKEADMLIVGGTSLSVYPAAGLIRYFSGKHLVLINKSITQYDIYADLVIHDSLGNIFAAL